VVQLLSTKKTNIHEVFCDSLAIEPTYSIITGIKMEISMTLAEVDSSMDLFLDANGQLDRSVIGTDLRSSAGELIIAINENGKEVIPICNLKVSNYPIKT